MPSKKIVIKIICWILPGILLSVFPGLELAAGTQPVIAQITQTIALQENFDGTTIPTLPANWLTVPVDGTTGSSATQSITVWPPEKPPQRPQYGLF